MKHTWTIKELKETSMKKFIMACLYDRKDTLTNVYSPLSKKIDEAVKWIDDRKGE